VIVGVDIREWEPGVRTGIGRFLEELLRAALPTRPGDRFVLLGTPASEARVGGDNVAVVRAAGRVTAWWDQVTLPRLAAAAGADLLYSPYIKVPLAAPMPVVCTIHDLLFFVVRERREPRAALVAALFRVFCWLVVRRAAAVLVDSEASARDVVRLLRADPARLRVIPLATSAAFAPAGPAGEDARVWERHGLAPGYVLYVGRLAPHKNVPRLVRAHAALAPALRARHPLVLVGGPMTPEVARALEEAGAPAARWLGPVTDADLPALYRGAALLGLPSRYEGFGLPLLEAMACGTPAVASTAPALVELADGAAVHAGPDDHAAWVTALGSLLEDPARRRALAAAGRARAAGYTAARTAAAVLAVLDDVRRRA
jgi:glycosyltransferase involved in cell wall biosynthesis